MAIAEFLKCGEWLVSSKCYLPASPDCQNSSSIHRATSATSITSTALAAGGEFVSPGAAELLFDTGAELQGGAFVSPGAHGHGISPAKVPTARTDIMVKEKASLFSFVMFFLLLVNGLASFLSDQRAACFKRRLVFFQTK